MIALENIQFHYPHSSVGVHDINLRVETGEFLVVVGASGSGKSTLLQLIAGFLTPLQGRVLLDHQDVTQLTCGERGLGIVLQDYVLFNHMTVLGNVATRLRSKAFAKKSAIDAPARFSMMWGLRRWKMFTLTSFPAASSSEWPLPARWYSSPAPFCSTNRFQRSTPPAASRCARSLSIYSVNSVSPR